MPISDWLDRLLGMVPRWVVLSLLSLSIVAAFYGWALSACSVTDLLFDSIRAVFIAVGLGNDLGRLFGSWCSRWPRSRVWRCSRVWPR